jgi:hypothetical protein
MAIVPDNECKIPTLTVSPEVFNATVFSGVAGLTGVVGAGVVSAGLVEAVSAGFGASAGFVSAGFVASAILSAGFSVDDIFVSVFGVSGVVLLHPQPAIPTTINPTISTLLNRFIVSAFPAAGQRGFRSDYRESTKAKAHRPKHLRHYLHAQFAMHESI